MHLFTKLDSGRILQSVINPQSNRGVCILPSQLKSHNHRLPAQAPPTAWRVGFLQTSKVKNITECSHVPVLSATTLRSCIGHICIYRRN